MEKHKILYDTTDQLSYKIGNNNNKHNFNKQKEKPFNDVTYLPMVVAQKSRENDQINKIWASQQNQASKKLSFWDMKPCGGRNKTVLCTDHDVPGGIKA